MLHLNWLLLCFLLSPQSPRLSLQMLRMNWRTCGQTWPLSLFCSHGTKWSPCRFPGNRFFFQLLCSGFNFWLNLLSGFLVIFFMLAGFVFTELVLLCLKCPDPLVFTEIISWVLMSMLVRPKAVIVGVSLICGSSCVLHYTFYLYILHCQTSDTTLNPEYIRNMCPSESSALS